MTRKVKMTLKQFEDFLSEVSEPFFKQNLYQWVEHVLIETLYGKVFVNDPKQTYHVKDKEQMKEFIRNKIRVPPPAKIYNPRYLKVKARGGYYPYVASMQPHRLTGNLMNSTRIDSGTDGVSIKMVRKQLPNQPPQRKLKRQSTKGSRKIYKPKYDKRQIKSFNYLLKHEKERSILKSTFVLAWENIMLTMMDILQQTAMMYAES